MTLAQGAQAGPAQDLETRIRALEASLEALKRELAESRAALPPVAPAPAGAPTGGPESATPASAAPASASAAAAPDGFRAGPLTLKYGGFVKLDATVSDFTGGDPANGDPARDFLLPGSIPVGGRSEDPEVDFNARQTRLWFTTAGEIAGRTIGARIEMDFQTLPGAGDQRTTSPSSLSLRRAYVTVDDWLFGQEWSTFQNVAVLPETGDYIGPSAGTVFVRQAQIRYARGGLSLAVENPETTVTPFGGGARIAADDSAVPDLVVRYDVKRPRAEFALAGLARRLSYAAGAVDGETTGYGVSASGKLLIGGRDDIRFMLTAGEGIGRYVGVNLANDAVIDADGDLRRLPLTAGFLAYRRYWAPAWRSTFMISGQAIDNPVTLTGAGASKNSRSGHVNVIWSPASGLDLGAEALVADRELESAASGELTRLILFGKYGF